MARTDENGELQTRPSCLATSSDLSGRHRRASAPDIEEGAGFLATNNELGNKKQKRLVARRLKAPEARSKG